MLGTPWTCRLAATVLLLAPVARAETIEQLKWLEFADMVPVKGGAFTIGSESNEDEKPRDKVEVDGFLAGATEVGGSCNDGEGELKVSRRAHQPPTTPSEEVGFRVVAK